MSTWPSASTAASTNRWRPSTVDTSATSGTAPSTPAAARLDAVAVAPADGHPHALGGEGARPRRGPGRRTLRRRRRSDRRVRGPWQGTYCRIPVRPGDAGWHDPAMRVEASEGLTADIDRAGTVRVGWGEADWFGPGFLVRPEGPEPSDLAASPTRPGRAGPACRSPAATCGARCWPSPTPSGRCSCSGSRRTPTSTASATGAFDQPSVGWPVFTPGDRLAGGAPDGPAGPRRSSTASSACPARPGADLDGFFLLPHRPPTGWPLAAQPPPTAARCSSPRSTPSTSRRSG